MTALELQEKYRKLATNVSDLDERIRLNDQFRIELEQLPDYVPPVTNFEKLEKDKLEFEQFTADAERIINSIKGAVVYNGVEYKLGEWVTITDYCRLYNKSHGTVMNWIARGIVPEHDLVIIPELNNLKLLRNTPYRQAS
ncbi:hypothetical protein BWI96_06975 [Siphonobacter sp. SORGH_AS_0500]|uniref:hypothetical protein n=1 Tax=Siphonobacter sp. SORGH_AS_0500 TaxID=1864824 RepID=UPI000CCB7143|nr:hypothetical protein [Siphonobacter sp. SORGH_AS_0500]PKK37099.1 hypothetical protein BWI96_06975 [Siphonobacter sp. SORGH_AS_0500]